MDELQLRIIRAIVVSYETAVAANPGDADDEKRTAAVTVHLTVAELRELQHYVRVIIPAGYALAKKVFEETKARK